MVSAANASGCSTADSLRMRGSPSKPPSRHRLRIHPSASCSPPMQPRKVSTYRTTVTASSIWRSPYNPNVMEQRNGRIDRHGQREKEVLIWHPVDGGDKGHVSVGGHGEDILRALRKLESIRADMGSVNPVIAPQMSGLIEGSLKGSGHRPRRGQDRQVQALRACRT